MSKRIIVPTLYEDVEVNPDLIEKRIKSASGVTIWVKNDNPNGVGTTIIESTMSFEQLDKEIKATKG